MLLICIILFNILVYREIQLIEGFSSSKTINIYITDWWDTKKTNFVTDILHLKYPNYQFNFTDNDPDILIYSAFGNNNANMKNIKNKIYILNEPHNYEESDERIINSTQPISWNYKLNDTKNHIYLNGFSFRIININ